MRQLFCLPLQFGGLGVFSPVIFATTRQFSLFCYFVNLFWVMLLLSWMHMLRLFSLPRALVDSIRKTCVLLFLISCYSLQQQAILRVKDFDFLSWLSVMPLKSLEMHLLFSTESHCWICRLFVMDLVLPLLSSMLKIVVLEAWLGSVIMK